MREQFLGINPTAAKKAVIYLRVSTEEQVDNYSLETQEDICVKEAHKRGLEVLQIFKEKGRSAKTIAGRPTLIEMLDFCRKNKRHIDTVIVYRLDRISRQTSDYLSIRKKLTECEITLISATEPTGNSPTEKFVETMLAGFAQMDNDVKSERTKNGLRARFLAGLPNGGVPLGYLNNKGFAVKDPKSFDSMAESWKLLATRTMSLRNISDFLFSKGICEEQAGREKCPIRPGTLDRMFRNKFYMGKVTSRKYSLEVQGQHVAMVSEDMFYQVQDALDGRNTTPSVKRFPDKQEFPLRRMVICSICGKSFTAAWSKGEHSVHGYYFCQNRCGKPSSVSLMNMEKEREKVFKKNTAKPETIELFISILRKTYYERIDSLQRKRENADIDLKKLYELRQSLIEKNLNGVYTDEMFKEQNRMLEERIKDLHVAKDDAVI